MSGWIVSASRRAGLGPALDVAAGIGIVRQPLQHVDATEPGGDDFEAPVAERHHAHDASNGADRRAHVAAAHLAAALDEDDTELGGVGGEAVEDELAVSRLEHVERQQLAGQHDVAEREHRQPHAPNVYPGPSSAALGPDGYDASTPANESQIGRYTLWSASVPVLLRIRANSIVPPPSTGR